MTTNDEDRLANDVSRWKEIDDSETDAKWERGDLAAHYVPQELKAGRKAADDDTPTLGDFCFQVGANYKRVSEYRICAMFYPENIRHDGQFKELSWTHFNVARRFAKGEVDNAAELLHEAILHHINNADDFRIHLKEKFAPPTGGTPLEETTPEVPHEDDEDADPVWDALNEQEPDAALYNFRLDSASRIGLDDLRRDMKGFMDEQEIGDGFSVTFYAVFKKK